MSPARFKEALRPISKPGARRAVVERYAADWTDRRGNLALAETPLGRPVLAIGGAARSGGCVERLFGPWRATRAAS